ncbi:anti-sigma-I factor RsgI family protein [Gracilibacillus lacisalsi]|uniref:anti-sigma-I factor RsgI family protein n=1 Tax=Gracilibacillus lacisalsi TaxID=393087 RepID=UPI000365C258|nr:hypothetical protein [Gracilibacillus lacisalsi]
MKQKIKGVVMEVQENQVVLMCDDGTFRNVPHDQHDIPAIGEYVTYRVKKSPLLLGNRKQVLPLVALAAILLFAIMNVSLFQPQQPAYLLAVDINPSMELSLDEDLHVIEITGLNEDANRVIKDLDVKGQGIDKVINEIVVRLKNDNYLSADTPAIITATWIELQDHSISNNSRSVEEIFNHSLGENHVEAEMEVYVESEDYYKKAKEVDLSVNSYRMYQEMSNDEVEVDIKDVQNKSVKELRQIAKKASERKNAERANSSSSPEKEEAAKNTKEETENSSSKHNSSTSVPKKEDEKQSEKEKNGEENKQNAEQAPSKEEKHNSDKKRTNEKSRPEKSNSPSNDQKKQKKMEKPPSNEKPEKANPKPEKQEQRDPEIPKKAEEKAADKGKSEEKSTKEIPKDQGKGNDSNKREE